MKRYIRCNSSEIGTQYAIGVFDASGKFIGYLFRYSEARGVSVIRCIDDANRAKTYASSTSAKRAIAYYKYFSKIFVYDKDHDLPIAQYMRFRDDTDPSEFNTDDCAYYSSKGCKLDVVELN